GTNTAWAPRRRPGRAEHGQHAPLSFITISPPTVHTHAPRYVTRPNDYLTTHHRPHRP
ncbi:hypothetical protein DAEQUDRAFT_724774, partial [Daedalea quercina L-15889]